LVVIKITGWWWSGRGRLTQRLNVAQSLVDVNVVVAQSLVVVEKVGEHTSGRSAAITVNIDSKRRRLEVNRSVVDEDKVVRINELDF
jgi:3-methyladenine DNA glycosylase Mpg